MKILLVICAVCLSCVNAKADGPLHIGVVNPLVLKRADPWILLHTDGWYYFTASVPEYDRVEIRKARTISELATASPVIVWRKHFLGEMAANIWAPELHSLTVRGTSIS